MEADKGLPFIQKLENVARYEDGKVIILDRRVYPAKTEFVECGHYEDVAQAIYDMVTQSYGPWVASAYGMVIAGKLAKDLSKEKAADELKKAAHVLTHARPTTSQGMVQSIQSILECGLAAVAEGKDPEQALLDHVNQTLEARYTNDRKLATYAVNLLPDPATVLTQCYAETLIGFILLVSLEQKKKISLICPETRPYLQGARLTASMSYDLGVPTTVITDNMPAYVLSQGKVNAFICAADVITMDGYVVNKIGTFQIALAAHYHKVPFYVTRNPSVENPTIDTVKIEERNPDETLYAMGIRTAKEGVSGYYPAFDITPPSLVSGVVTSQGVFSPFDLKGHFE
jgi:methylthioribose-1-phosphate isomerase